MCYELHTLLNLCILNIQHSTDQQATSMYAKFSGVQQATEQSHSTGTDCYGNYLKYLHDSEINAKIE